MFAQHRVPTTLVADNGLQYVSQEMNQFLATYGFNHITNSPYYVQSNRLAERTVKTVKDLLSNSPDPFVTLLSYRATPLTWCYLSPSELLMSHVIRTDVTKNTSKFHPEWLYFTEFKAKEERYRNNQKCKRHRTKYLPELSEDTCVWVETPNEQIPRRIMSAK